MRAVGVLALLGGLLGMHVLGDHGAGGSHDVAMVTAAGVEATPVGSGVHMPADAEAGTVPVGHAPSDDPVFAMLCVLALLAGILVLLPPSARRVLRRLADPAASIPRPRAPGEAAPPPSPPSLHVLCISRR